MGCCAYLRSMKLWVFGSISMSRGACHPKSRPATCTARVHVRPGLLWLQGEHAWDSSSKGETSPCTSTQGRTEQLVHLRLQHGSQRLSPFTPLWPVTSRLRSV